MSQAPIHIIAKTDPLRSGRVIADVPAGGSLVQCLIAAGLRLPSPEEATPHLFLGDRPVPVALWGRVYPKAGTTISVAVEPEGDDVGRTILTVVVAAAAAATGSWAAGAAAGNFGLGTFGTAMVKAGTTAAVGTVGQLAVNALIPPATPGGSSGGGASQEDPVFSITSGDNADGRYRPIPLVLGRHKVNPLRVASASRLVGNDQYLTELFLVGHGPLAIHDVRIGGTSTDNFDDIELEVREGRPGDPARRLLPELVTESQVGARLTTDWTVRTTEPETDEIVVDVQWPQGLTNFNDDGSRSSRSSVIEVQVAPTGTDDWSVASDGKVFDARSVRGGSSPGFYRTRDYTRARVQYVRVSMDRKTGALRRRRGTPSGSSDSASVPSVPLNELPIARARLSGVDDDLYSLTDERGELDLFGDDDDFTPSLSGNAIELAGGELSYNGLAVRARTGEPLRRGIRFSVERGQHDVRVRRMTSESSSTQVRDQAAWAVLRSIKDEDPIAADGLATIAIDVRASDQLSGRLERVSCIAESEIEAYDPGAGMWRTMPSGNPAALARRILQSPALDDPLAGGRIDWTSFEAASQAWDQAGLELGLVIDGQMTVAEALETVLTAGRARRDAIDARIGILRDEPGDGPVQHFSPRNSRDFTLSPAYARLPHGLRCRFINPDRDFELDELVVYADGYDADIAERFESLDLDVAMREDDVHRHGRYHLAVGRLRRERAQLTTGIGHLVCRPGDLVAVSHPVMLVGLGAGRIRAVSTDGDDQVVAVTLDRSVTMEDGVDYGLRVVTPAGEVIWAQLETEPGETTELVLAEPTDGLAVGQHAVAGEYGEETETWKVKEKEALPDLEARLTLVPEAPGVHDAEKEIPDYAPRITLPPGRMVPEIRAVASNDDILVRSGDGSLESRILVTLGRPDQRPGDIEAIEAQWRRADTDEDWSRTTVAADASAVSIRPVEDSESYELRLRYVYPGLPGGWNDRTHTVIGKTRVPTVVQRLRAVQDGEQVALGWRPVPDPDVAGYELRYARRGNGWGDGLTISEVERGTRSAVVDVPPGDWAFMVKAVDVKGNKSPAAATADLRVGTRYLEITAQDYGPSWSPGRMRGLRRVGDALWPTGGPVAVWEGPTIDLGFVASTVRVYADLDVASSPVSETIDRGRIIDAVAETVTRGRITDTVAETVGHGRVSGETGLDDGAIRHEIAVAGDSRDWYGPNATTSRGRITEPVGEAVPRGRITQDVGSRADNGPLVTAWQDWTKGTVDARYLKHRVVVDGDRESQRYIRDVRAVADQAERSERHDDVAIPEGGALIAFDRHFHLTPSVVALTADDDGRYPVRMAKDAHGVELKILDPGGDDVGGQVDVIATGV